jgi:glutathione S-transferase
VAELILHHFQASPFSEKIRRVLGYKGLEWKSVLVPVTLPKPDVQALTGGYRRTPLLQIGADVYCDTALICDVLEHVQPTPTLYPTPNKGLARIVAQWADSTLFWAAIAGPRVPEHRWGGGPSDSADAFDADRNAMFGALPRLRPADAAAARKSYLRRLSDMLQHGPYLLGDAPSIADFAASAALWFTRVREPTSADFLQPVPALIGWMERLQAFGQGRSEPLTSIQAIARAAATEPSMPGQGILADSTFQDEHGIELGSPVSIRAESFGPEASTGRLIAATRTHYSIERRDPRAGTLHVHFPRIGYVLESAAN